MKTVQLNLNITFQDSINDDAEIAEIMQNVLLALNHAACTSGIAPENSETFTKKVEVTDKFNPENTATIDIV